MFLRSARGDTIVDNTVKLNWPKTEKLIKKKHKLGFLDLGDNFIEVSKSLVFDITSISF
jgi:hypothetical protein